MKVGDESIHVLKQVAVLLPSKVPVIAFARFVVVANNADLFDHIGQPIFEVVL
ncbi:MAG: hypothetical protein KJZ86_08665 [Caldilineaceae bacterium]|nr:hypothetical protein [Caldilineaceae bacterium]HRJ45495.1 hypothetical protein [Caldilineaceae bacterium]